MLLLLVACTGSTTIPTDTGSPADSAADSGGEDSGEAPRDMDADGYDATVDCLDLNANVNPAATEVWNGLDDDCDGSLDADGVWSGSVRLLASAVYEGRRYDFDLDCPFSGVRTGSVFVWEAVCTPDPSDSYGQLLLGATLTLTPDDNPVSEDRWEGDVVLTSSNDWDSEADGSADWRSFDQAALEASLSAPFLTVELSGTLRRE